MKTIKTASSTFILALTILLIGSAETSFAQTQNYFGDCRGRTGPTVSNIDINSILVQETGRGNWLSTQILINKRPIIPFIRGQFGTEIASFIGQLMNSGYSTVDMVSYSMGGWYIAGNRNPRVEQEARERQAQVQRSQTSRIAASNWPDRDRISINTSSSSSSQGNTSYKEDGDPVITDIIIENTNPARLRVYGFNLNGKDLYRKYGLDLIAYGSPLKLVQTTNSLGGNVYVSEIPDKCAYPTNPRLGSGIDYTLFTVKGANKTTAITKEIVISTCR